MQYPACEHCGMQSYEGSQDEPVRCPFCGKYKRRGSREELLAALRDAQNALYGAVGYLTGQSVSSEEALITWFKDAIKRIEDV